MIREADHLRDRPGLAALDEASTTFNRQRGITVRHEGRLLLLAWRVAWSLLILAAEGLPFLLPPTRWSVVNVLPRNT